MQSLSLYYSPRHADKDTTQLRCIGRTGPGHP